MGYTKEQLKAMKAAVEAKMVKLDSWGTSDDDEACDARLESYERLLDELESIELMLSVFAPTMPVDDNDEWRRERAQEAGMLHGCDAYNEVMGY
jgi:hypothetical protein